MIAFGCAITAGKIYERFAEPGIRLAAEPDSEILVHATTGSIFRNYNLLLDRAAKRDGLEALVLLHQDAEIVDPEFCAKVREALRDPEVALVGCAGAIGVRNIAWWQGSVTWASFTHHYEELGGGEIEALSWQRDAIPVHAHTGEVDAIDGFVMAVSPWAVRELRFDESLGQALHGYDFDYCLQAREAGRKVVTADFRVIHHHSLTLIGNVESWIEAHIKIAEKWDGRIPGVGAGGGDWKQRARRAEAEASAAQTQAGAERILREATVKALQEERAKIKALKREIAVYRNSKSWRIAAPGRWLGRALRRLLHPRRNSESRNPATARRSLSAKPPSRDGRPTDAVRRSTQKL
jgi:Glycosyltransferase like family